ncbi:MAG: hypothetical protein HFE72_04330 [Emergencia sp.]|nr:hypothetical protein [Emergencia sp.]
MFEFDLIRAESAGEVTLRGKKIEYRTMSEEFLLYDDAGNPDATIFTISYERKGVNTEGRPVLFAYNGGPGCASLLVHMGALGPQRVAMGDGVNLPFETPYHMEENPDCILDICDLVMIDPVGTGYSRILKEEAADKYYNSETDAKAVIMTMYQWIETHHRWNCPLLILGESYGTIRSAMVADQIFVNKIGNTCNALNMHLDGIILLGSALDRDKSKFLIEPSVINFSAVAATNWYHMQDEKPSLENYLNEAEKFAYGDYLSALALGRRVADEKYEHVLDQLQYFTSLSKQILKSENLRVWAFQYPSLRMKDGKDLISVYDGRFTSAPVAAASDYEWEDDDPCCCRIMPAFTHCFHAYMKEFLGIETNRIYTGENMHLFDVWQFNASKNPVHFLESAMRKNQNLKLFFANGYYDLATTKGYVDYMINRFDLPEDRIWTQGYESGHMCYIGEDAAKKLGQDLRKFVTWICGNDSKVAEKENLEVSK